MKKQVVLPLCCILLLCFLVLGPQMAFAQWTDAYQWTASYIPPEALYNDERRQVVHIPRKINLNRSPLAQLEVLPGIDENLALKIMRNRPFTNFHDFAQKISQYSPKRTQRLLARIQGKALF